MPATTFKDAERKQMSLLAAAEKRTLIWLAHRLPAWVNSDHLTMLGFVAMACAGLAYWAARYDRRAMDRYSTCTGLRGAMVRAGIAGR